MKGERVAKLLRWLAAEVEKGEARLAIDIAIDTDIVREPQSWRDAGKRPTMSVRNNGATWTITGKSLRTPPGDS